MANIIRPLLHLRGSWILILVPVAIILAAMWLWTAPDGRAVLEQIMGETPQDKVAAYIAAVRRGDEAGAFEVWQLPNLADEERVHKLGDRRERVTKSLVAAGISPHFEVLSIEWWGTCCEPGVTDDPRGAGGARLHIRLVDRNGSLMAYVVDVFVRDLPYWGSALAYPLRHWVIRDAYMEGDEPLFWRFASGAPIPRYDSGPARAPGGRLAGFVACAAKLLAEASRSVPEGGTRPACASAFFAGVPAGFLEGVLPATAREKALSVAPVSRQLSHRDAPQSSHRWPSTEEMLSPLDFVNPFVTEASQ